MSERSRRRVAWWLAGALLTVAVAGAVSTAGAARSEATRKVTFRGYTVEVPASWPVVDLTRNPSACVRFDVHAVYLGHPGSDASCPARAVGRTEALLVEPIDHVSRPRVKADTAWAPQGSAAVRSVPSPEDHEVTFGVSSAGVLVTGSYGDDRATLADVVQSATLTEQAQPAPELAPASSDGSASASVIAPGTFTGRGFDACTAPSSGAMQAWLASSPYRAVGVYVGGINRACMQPNLTASWVSSQTSQGWTLIPIYVGLQAPCTGFTRRIDPASAASQGRAAADDAAVDAGSLGMGAGSVVYLDMEAYPADTACREAVLTFLSNWSTRLHELGYLSGVYSSVNSGIRDLVSVYDSTTFVRPDHVWFARWDGVATVSDSVIPAGDWANHQRLKQYQGDHDETYGNVTINIDNDFLDVTSGAPPPPPVDDGDQAAPAVVTLGSEIHVLARGTDKRLYEAFFRSGVWSSWAPLGTLTIEGTPAAVRYGTGINVYARGTDQRLYEAFLRPASGWSSWAPHAGISLAGDPAAVTYGTGINVYARGTDQRLYETFFRPTTRWSSWAPHGGVSVAGDPSLVSLGTEIHVFARGADGGLYETFFRSGFGWSIWTPHAGIAVAGDPSAVPYGTGGINLYARGTDQRLHETYFRPASGWSAWSSHAGIALAGDPAAMTSGTEIHVFARTTADALSETFFRSGVGWSAWTAHGGVTIAGTAAAVPYGTGGINLYARGKDNHLYETYFRTSSGWSGWGLKGGAAVPIA